MIVVVSSAETVVAQQQSLTAPGKAPRVVRKQPDSSATRRDLRKAIERFQDRWRSEWQRGEIERHPMINLTQIRGWLVNSKGRIEPPINQGDRVSMNMTPELRRYLAMLCIIDSPSDRQIEAAKQKWFAQRGAVPTRDFNTEQLPSSLTQTEPAFAINPTISQNRIHDAKGSVCPQWIPEDTDTPLDEGESIDLALPLPKRRDIGRDREVLLEQLDAAHDAFPSDTWIVGQRLRFAIDQRQRARALAIAQACTGDTVQCLRLRGLAYDFADSLAVADSLYRVADSLERVAVPSDSTFCADEDALMLLSKADSASVREKSCADQRRMIDRLWWLADPLWSMPGNERLVAHRSRQTHYLLRSALSRDERYVWSNEGGGRGLRAMLMRYGWPSYTYWPGGTFEEEISKYREISPAVWFVAPPYTAKEYLPDRQSLMPKFSAIESPLLAKPTDWQPSAPEGTPTISWWPREHMKLWTTLLPLPEGQRTALRRDSAILLASAIDDPVGQVRSNADEPWTATLMGSTSPSDIRMLVQTTIVGSQTLRFQSTIASAPLVLSNEVRVLDGRGPTLRTREGFTPPLTLSEMTPRTAALSSPVFVRLPDGVSDAPADPDSAISLMAGSLVLERSARHAVYWESYGFAPGDTLNVRLRVVRDEEAGIARSIVQRLGVVDDRRDSVTISWREPDNRKSTSINTTSMPTLSRSILLNLRELPEGAYRLSIEMTRTDGLRTQGEQRFQLRD